MSDPGHQIRGERLVVGYRRSRPVLHQVDVSADAGQMLSILGPNGSGKTTLLRCLLGLLPPTHGKVLLDGVELGRRTRRQLARQLAYVPQQASSSFAFTVREIVETGRFAHAGMLSLVGESDEQAIASAMDRTSTSDLADRTLGELSGGQAQCVMIARALAQRPDVLLLDEPTSHLDLKNQLEIYRLMRRLASEESMVVICVSHDVNLAARFADRLMILRDGRVLAAGPAGEVMREDVLERAYDVKVEFLPGADGRIPLVRAH